MKTVAMIPVKAHSQRIPGKNMKPFYDGTPLLTLIQKVCMQTETVDETYVYCSDESIRKYILEGVKFLKRPQSLDADTVNCNMIIREFIKEVDADIYVNTHTTAPFSKPGTIDLCVRKVAQGAYDSAFCAVRVNSFLWSDGKPLNFDPDHFPRTQDLPLIYAEADEAYVFTKHTFMTYGRRVGIHPYVHEIDKIEGVDIDDPADFEIADAIYRGIINK